MQFLKGVGWGGWGFEKAWKKVRAISILLKWMPPGMEKAVGACIDYVQNNELRLDLFDTHPKP
jgi:hypothetical protein